MSELGVVITACAGRESNLEVVLDHLGLADPELRIMVVDDGGELACGSREMRRGIGFCRLFDKHEPGREQPRNIGVRVLRSVRPSITHVWFLDSDVVPDPRALPAVRQAIAAGESKDAILVAPYEWLPAGLRPSGVPDPVWLTAARQVRTPAEPRWPMFEQSPPGPFRGDLSKGLACWGGNLVWPVAEFERVGGFWNELHHGRCEDGELGARAVAMDVPIFLLPEATGYHLYHDTNDAEKLRRNEIDVPKINARHPWLQGAGLFVVDRDGRSFSASCRECGELVPTGAWWAHIAIHGFPSPE